MNKPTKPSEPTGSISKEEWLEAMGAADNKFMATERTHDCNDMNVRLHSGPTAPGWEIFITKEGEVTFSDTITIAEVATMDETHLHLFRALIDKALEMKAAEKHD